MTTHPPSRPDDVYIAPPMAGDQLDDFVEPPRWPKTVGVISIVWGSLGLCCNVVFGAFMAFQPALMKMAQDGGQFTDGLPPSMTQVSIPMMVLAALGLLLSIVLIVAGSTLAARNPAARTMHLAYAVLAVLLVAVSTYMQLSMQTELAQWVRDNPNTMFAQQQSQQAAMRYVGPALGILIGMAWPAFCLIWFGLVKKDPKEIARGLENRAA
jgi:uncharacterized membrane protein